MDGVIPAKFAKVHPVHRSPIIGTLQTVITLVVALGFAAVQLDPYAQMTAWLNTTGVIGIVSLLAGTAAAAATYFWRGEAKASPNRLILCTTSAAASPLLTFVAGSIIVNAEFMTGVADATNIVLVAGPFVVVLIAATLTGRLTKSRAQGAAPATEPIPLKTD